MKTPAGRLLLACVDAAITGNAIERIAREGADPQIEWPDFVRLVLRHRIAPLAVDGLQKAGVKAPDRLVTEARANKLAALGQVAESRRLLTVLDDAGIEAAVLKGPALSQQLFGDPAMRQSKDIDLLVEWHDFRGAIERLEAIGYELAGPRPPFDTSRIDVWRRGWGAKDVALVHPEGTYRIELHNRLFSVDALLPGLALADLRQTVAIGGARFRAFDTADLFAYLATHGATTFWHRLKWLADIRAILEVSNADGLLERCRVLGVERCGALAVLLCHRLWGVALPKQIATLLAEDSALANLDRRCMQALSQDDGDGSAAETMRRTAASYLLRDDFAYKRSLTEAMLYHDRLVARLPLPRALAPLYAPARLVDWLASRGR